jgi:hypothetical protein
MDGHSLVFLATTVPKTAFFCIYVKKRKWCLAETLTIRGFQTIQPGRFECGKLNRVEFWKIKKA